MFQGTFELQELKYNSRATSPLHSIRSDNHPLPTIPCCKTYLDSFLDLFQLAFQPAETARSSLKVYSCFVNVLTRAQIASPVRWIHSSFWFDFPQTIPQRDTAATNSWDSSRMIPALSGLYLTIQSCQSSYRKLIILTYQCSYWTCLYNRTFQNPFRYCPSLSLPFREKV